MSAPARVDIRVSSGATLLSGWGRTAPTSAQVVAPASADEVSAVLAGAAKAGGVVPRGLGRSYGDAAQCAGGMVVSTDRLDRVLGWDPATGIVRAGAGASLDALMRHFVPRGWFVPVTPGTRHVSLGGAVAADIHGKNHHRDGSFGGYVESMTLVSPTGAHRLSRGDEAAGSYWSTVGGMGMTGLITDVSLRLVAIETAYMRVDTERADTLDEVMSRMTDSDAGFRYSVAWIDCLAKGARLGRGVLTSADHAQLADLPSRLRGQPLGFAPRQRLDIAFTAPSGLLNPLTVAVFNELWFRKAPRRRQGQIQGLATFFHPLDGVGSWNRLYGKRGFLQYQLVVPPSGSEVVRRALEALGAAGVPSFLAVLKRFGPRDPAPMSFPIEGWTLALDIPIGGRSLGPVLDDVDEMVAAAGGRVYLAKDARLRPELVPIMYPELDHWRAQCRVLDPEGVMISDLGRRLGWLDTKPDMEKGR